MATETHLPSDPSAGRASSSASYRLDRLRIRHLRLLEIIHRRGSLGAAAKELGLSQPAVTLMLRELELVFGTNLVERDVRGGRLTAAGLLAVERLTAAMASLDRALEAAQPLGREPPLRLGCSQVAGVRVLPRALAWMDTHARITPLHIIEGEALALLADLVAGKLDCVIAWVDESVSALYPLDLFDMTPLWHGRMQVVAAAGHPLARESRVSMASLGAAAWLLPRPASRTYAAFLKLFVQGGHTPPPVTVECASIHSGLQMVAATSLLTITPDTVAQHYSQLGGIATLKLKAIEPSDTHASLIYLKDNRGLSAIATLRRALLETADGGTTRRRAR